MSIRRCSEVRLWIIWRLSKTDQISFLIWKVAWTSEKLDRDRADRFGVNLGIVSEDIETPGHVSQGRYRVCLEKSCKPQEKVELCSKARSFICRAFFDCWWLRMMIDEGVDPERPNTRMMRTMLTRRGRRRSLTWSQSVSQEMFSCHQSWSAL